MSESVRAESTKLLQSLQDMFQEVHNNNYNSNTKKTTTTTMNAHSMPISREHHESVFHNNSSGSSNRDTTATNRTSVEETIGPGRIFPDSARQATRVAATGNYNHSHQKPPGTKKKDLGIKARSYNNNGVGTSSNSTTAATTISDAEHFLLEPNAMWEDLRTAARLQGYAVDFVSPEAQELQAYTNKANCVELPKTSTTSHHLNLIHPQKVIDFLMHQRLLMMRASATADNATSTTTPKPKTIGASNGAMGQTTQGTPTPSQSAATDPNNKKNSTTNEIDQLIDSDYFLDGLEMERNVVVDYETDRSYVYTTDVERKWKLPEFLFLDVPNSTYAARACGQFITNKLIFDMIQIVKKGSKKTESALEVLVKSCNKSDYEVANIFVPLERVEHGRTHNSNTNNSDSSKSTNTETPVQAITVRFRLRYARFGTNIHKMLSHNFMNGQNCLRGILVFIPCMEQDSQAQRFWGSLQGVNPLPKIDDTISNAKMDKWCMQVARKHGTFRGNDPEALGLAVVDRNNGGKAYSPYFPKPRKRTLPTRSAKRTPTQKAVTARKTKTTKTKSKAKPPKKNASSKSVVACAKTQEQFLREVLANVAEKVNSDEKIEVREI